MGHRVTRAALLLIGLIGAGTAQASLSCIELGQFVEGAAQARDRGQTQSRLISLLMEEKNFDASEKKTLREYTRLVFQSRDIPPKALSNMAVDSCYKSQTGK